MLPPSERKNNTWLWVAGGIAVVLTLVVLVYIYAISNNGGTGSVASSGPTPAANSSFHPPAVTPLANPPSAPAGDGTTATIQTEMGTITFQLYTESAPVASQNFIDLANANFYDGVVFHRVVPNFMIQGGDPLGTGGGGPGYTIPDEPVVGEYNRGEVAMARTQEPNSQGSQFFILVKDSPFLDGGDYTIFGHVTSGMDVVDQIVNVPTRNDDPGGSGGTAIDPVVMTSVTIQPPGASSPSPLAPSPSLPASVPASLPASVPASLPASVPASPSSTT
jgi:peptidyl-prolyl cis-trans isomerase B (cyclophilin B)